MAEPTLLETPQRTRGFAAMSPERQRAIASMGGRAVSQNRDHMSTIGREGGKNSHGTRQTPPANR